MKKILYACGQLPWPLDNGQKIAAFNDLTYLSRYFEIDVVSYIDPINVPAQEIALEHLRTKLPNVNFFKPIVHHILRGDSVTKKALVFLIGAIKALPYVVNKYRRSEYTRRVKTALASNAYTILYIENLAPSYVLAHISTRMLSKIKLVYRAHDRFAEISASYANELSNSWITLAARLDARICDRYEKQLWRRADVILPVTRRLGTMIGNEDASLRPKIQYFPIFVEPINELVQHTDESLRVLYIGTVHFPPNFLGLKWFLQQCWPLVLQQFPAATLDIVGRGGDELRPVHESVTIRNYVDDLTPIYAAADVFVVPLFSGSGVRLKILDALNHAIPLVSTRTGYAGLEIEEGRHILVANDPEGFAKHICHLLGDPKAREQLARNGKEFLETNHSPALVGQIIDSLRDLICDAETVICTTT